jgi:hypothetical protein
MTLDTAVACLVATAHRLELALHDPGPWTVSWDGLSVPARRQVLADRVVFTALFPGRPCGTQSAVLSLRGQMLGARPVCAPDSGVWEFSWTLQVPEMASL